MPTIEPPAEPAFIETLKIAAYGKFGSRKTLQIASLISLYGADRVVVVSAEHGLNTIKSVVKHVIPVGNLGDLRAAYARVSKEFNTAQHWVCVDGMSRVMEWIANEQLSGADAYYDAVCKGSKHEELPETLKPYGRYMSDGGKIDAMKIYGRIGRESQNLLSAWIRLPSNLYCNYLEDMAGNSGREKSLPRGPDVPGQVGLKAVMSSFDYVIRLGYDTEGRLVGGLDPASRLYMARTREDRTVGQALPKEITGFDLGEFIGKHLGRVQ